MYFLFPSAVIGGPNISYKKKTKKISGKEAKPDIIQFPQLGLDSSDKPPKSGGRIPYDHLDQRTSTQLGLASHWLKCG